MVNGRCRVLLVSGQGEHAMGSVLVVWIQETGGVKSVSGASGAKEEVLRCLGEMADGRVQLLGKGRER